MRASTSLSVLLAFSAWFTGCSGERLAFDSNGVSGRAETLFRAQQDQDGNHANEVVAYWGHTPGNRNSSILDLCKESELDVVIAGWIIDFSLPGGFPRFDFGAGCMNMTPGKAAMNSSCGDRSKEMSSCQGLGKKVFIGIGGASSSITFTSRQDAVDAADTLWSLFGNTTSPQVYQPFPDVSVDGFDLGKLQQPSSFPPL
jgi:chitinase